MDSTYYTETVKILYMVSVVLWFNHLWQAGYYFYGFNPCKQPLVEMHGKIAYNRPLWFGSFLDPAHNGRLGAPGCPFLAIYQNKGFENTDAELYPPNPLGP